jgi:hypothetical protein
MKEVGPVITIPIHSDSIGIQKANEVTIYKYDCHCEQDICNGRHHPSNMIETQQKTNQNEHIADNIASVTRDECEANSVEANINNCTNNTGNSKEFINKPIKKAVMYSRSLSKESIVTLVQNINRKGGVTFIVIIVISVFGFFINQTQRDQLIILYLKCCGLASYLLAWYWISAKNEIRVATNMIITQALDRLLCGKLSLCIVPPCFE